MKIWLPYVATNTGSSTFMRVLADWLRAHGHEADPQVFPHALQYTPDLLRSVAPPPGTDAVITNSWAGFAFHRPGLRSICIEHLFVLDPVLDPYKSFAQRVFHELFVRNFISRSYASASVVAAVSRYTAVRMREVFPHLAVEVVPNGVDIDIFRPTEAPRPQSDRPFALLYCGTPSVRKGADLLAPIMEQLGPGYELRLTCARQDLPSLGAVPGVAFLGRLDLQSLIEQYRSCDLLLMPTRLEGLPLAVLEAMACGLPVVASDQASLPELVEGGVTGVLCPVDDVAGFAGAIAGLRDEPALTEAMSRAARKRITDRYSLDQMGRAYLSLLGLS